jgi:hypothetical protein
MTGVASKSYSEKDFHTAYKNRRGGFQISFDMTPNKMHFSWRTIMECPTSYMFFGPPLSNTRAFDNVFYRVYNEDRLYHRFIYFYDEFKGDAIACMSLYNSYLHAIISSMENRAKMEKKKQKHYDGGIFRTPKVVSFLKAIDEACMEQTSKVFTGW